MSFDQSITLDELLVLLLRLKGQGRGDAPVFAKTPYGQFLR